VPQASVTGAAKSPDPQAIHRGQKSIPTWLIISDSETQVVPIPDLWMIGSDFTGERKCTRTITSNHLSSGDGWWAVLTSTTTRFMGWLTRFIYLLLYLFPGYLPSVTFWTYAHQFFSGEKPMRKFNRVFNLAIDY